MLFNDERILDCVSYGSEFSQEFNTRVVQLRSGVERRNADWAAPLGRFSVRYDNLNPPDHLKVRHAHMACMGQLVAFRFKDWTDYQTDDEYLGAGTGAQQTLQLIKTYSFGPLTYSRKISKPVVATVYANGLPVVADIDYSTGLIVVTAAAGAVISWTGEFDVPVRFDSDRLDCQPAAKVQGGYILTSDVGLTEVRL